MGAENECLGCGVDFDYDLDACPACGWEPAAFAARGRYGLAKSGHGDPADEGEDDRDGAGGPPPGPGGLIGF